MSTNVDSEATFFIDKKPVITAKSKLKRELSAEHISNELCSKKRRFKESRYEESNFPEQNKKHSKSTEKYGEEEQDSGIKAAVVYYENILKDLKKGIDNDMKEAFVCNVLEESEGKEIELACHSLTSHCLEILLNECEDPSILQRFMSAFQKHKEPAFTSANASHLTELLMQRAVKFLQNWFEIIDSEENKEKAFITYCINWLEDLGNFALENLDDCLHSQYSCHVLCTLFAALAGDLVGNKELMSKNLRNHKKEFQSQFSDLSSFKRVQEQNFTVLDQIPKSFSHVLKVFYKSLLNSETLTDFVKDSCSATVIEALIYALKKRHQKACNKMIKKLAKKMFLERNKDNAPSLLFHKNASYVFDEMFKVADDDLQLFLWNEYINDHVEKLAFDPIGNFVLQRLYDAIRDRNLFEIACKSTWCLFDKILECQNYGIFVSISSACNRLSSQQAFFMENIMKCLQCFEPVERQDLVIPLLLGFQIYDNYLMVKKDNDDLKICLQGSLVVQAVVKYQKPLKVVKSMLSMSPEQIKFLSGHIQGCHVLNAFFGSITVGDKNKEKLLHHIQPVLVSVACDRNKSLTLSRIWTSLSLKLKEIVARELAKQQNALKNTKSGYGIFQKFGIPRFRKLPEWRQMQSNITSIKKPQRQ